MHINTILLTFQFIHLFYILILDVIDLGWEGGGVIAKDEINVPIALSAFRDNKGVTGFRVSTFKNLF